MLALVKIPKENFILDSGLTVILDNIKDPGNMGTIIRLCDWFGIKQIICSPQTVDVFNTKVVQSSMGSLFRVNISYIDLVRYLSNYKGRTVYGSFLDGLSVSESHIDKSGIIIFGNESEGISEQLIPYITNKITIDGRNKNNVNSLNVATAVGIILHSFTSQVT